MPDVSRHVRRWRNKKARVYARCDGRCFYCCRGLAIGDSTLDHVVPTSKGGTSRDSNLVIACRPCNAGKSNKSAFGFVAKKQARKAWWPRKRRRVA